MVKQLKGIITPLVTPFERNGEIMWQGVQQQIEHQVKCGVHGLVILATTGEAQSLSFEERKRIIEVAAETNAGRLPLVVGVGGTNARETFALIEYSEAVGADGLFVITPYFYRFTRDQYRAYYQEISRRCKTQILMYNSTYADTPLDPELVAELAELPNVTGLKEGNPLQTAEVIRRTGGKLSVFTARDVYLCETMAMGGAGGIFFSANAAPAFALELYERLSAGDYKRGLELQFQLAPLIWALIARSFPAGIKAALNLLGLPGGYVRFPLTDYDDVELEKMRRVLKDLQLL